MFEATRDVSEPMTRFFERVPVGPFTRSDTAEAIREPLRSIHYPLNIGESAIDRIYDQTLGHPYFVSFVMRELVDLAAAQNLMVMDEAFVDMHWLAITERLGEEKFAAEWHQATDGEREVLELVAQNLPVSHAKRSGTALAARLVSKGLLSKQGRGQYILYHPLFADYVLRSQKL